MSEMFMIAVVLLALGVAVAVPAMRWARRKVGSLPDDSPGRRRVTPFGYVYAVCLTVPLLAVFGSRELFPDSSPLLQFGGMVLVIGMGWAVEKLAARFGFNIVDDQSRK